MVSSTVLTLVVIPAIYGLVKERRPTLRQERRAAVHAGLPRAAE
jgi:Cu(I)/Ag(I) efflux system membrane protein CusA/SilA